DRKRARSANAHLSGFELVVPLVVDFKSSCEQGAEASKIRIAGRAELFANDGGCQLACLGEPGRIRLLLGEVEGIHADVLGEGREKLEQVLIDLVIEDDRVSALRGGEAQEVVAPVEGVQAPDP